VYHPLTADGRLLFATRFLRMFAYGALSVVLVLYLKAVGLKEEQVGLLVTLILLGDVGISLWITTAADRIGRRRMLVLGSLLMLFASVLFAVTDNFWLLLVAGTIGVISPSGNEVGPFLSVEHAALAQTIPDERRTQVFAWHNLVGSVATAVGALGGGATAQFWQDAGAHGAEIYRPVVIGYGVIGIGLAILFTFLSPAAEAPRTSAAAGEQPRGFFGLHRSRRVVFLLAALFTLDAFGGGFVMQSFVADWFQVRFNAPPWWIGSIFFGANLLAAVSALAAAWVARRIGLVNTMVFTHLPSNLLLILVPFMPTLPLAILVLLLRFSISQMDVPTRQSYTIAVVHLDERSAAAGITAVARSVGAAVSPSITGALLAVPSLIGYPFFLAGGIKIIYDIFLYRMFVAVRPPEERAPQVPGASD
jgi:MFS family permease